MAISRSERFVYFQNKANHYFKLKNIRSSIDHSPPKALIPKAKVFRQVPLLKQHQIQTQNEQLIDRLVKIAKSQQTQITVDGNYSRYNRVERPFRDVSSFRIQQERAITIDNSDMKTRLLKIKPAIGTNRDWNRDYNRSLNCRNNLRKYQEDNKSKAELHISADKFIPQHLRDYGLRDNLDASMNKQTSVPLEKLFELPQITKSSKRFDFNCHELRRQKSISALDEKE